MKHRRNATVCRGWISDELFFSPEDIEGELWISFNTFNGFTLDDTYQVSNKGRLRHLDGKFIRGCINHDGYHDISIAIASSSNRLYTTMHKLVLTLFKGPPPKDMQKPTVQHINHNKLDNRIENLCWMTAFRNNQEGHGYRVKLVDSSGEHIFDSQKSASKYLGRYEDYVSECIRTGYKLTNVMGQHVQVYVETASGWDLHTDPKYLNKNRCRIVYEGNQYDFDSYQACSKFLHKPEHYVSDMLHNGWNILADDSSIFYTYDLHTNEYIKYTPSKHRTRPHSTRCRIIQSSNNFIEFNSVSEAAKYLGRNSEYVRVNLNTGTPIRDKNNNIVNIVKLGD